MKKEKLEKEIEELEEAIRGQKERYKKLIDWLNERDSQIMRDYSDYLLAIELGFINPS